MKKVQIEDTSHKSMAGTYGMIDTELNRLGIYYTFKLIDRMQERNLSVRKLSALTGLRLATISDLMNGKKQAINLHHLTVLMVVLRIKDMTDLVEIHIPTELKEQMEREAVEWKYSQQQPFEVTRLSNIIKGCNGE